MIPHVATELCLVGPRKMELRKAEIGPIGETDVLVKSRMSAISHGTEGNQYRGTVPFANKTWVPSKRLFLNSEAPRQQRIGSLGYENVGEVVAVGQKVSTFRVGDLVWCWAGHVDYYVFEESDSTEGLWPPQRKRYAVKLPPNVAVEQGVFTALGQVALSAVHDAAVKVGDYVVVIGAGTIGLLCTQLALLDGARRVFVADPIESRRKMAESFGAISLDPTAVDVALAVHDATGGRGADVAIESSGNQKGIHEAIRCAGFAGRVVTLGFYQGGAPDLRLGEEWHHNRVTMLSSMSVWLCPSRYYPQWEIMRSFETVLDLFERRELDVSKMISHKIPFKDGAEAYRLIDEHPERVVRVALVYE